MPKTSNEIFLRSIKEAHSFFINSSLVWAFTKYKKIKKERSIVINEIKKKALNWPLIIPITMPTRLAATTKDKVTMKKAKCFLIFIRLTL